VGESFAWSLLHAMPDGVVMVEGGGRIVFVSRRAEALFGYDRGELLGEMIEILVPADRREAHREHRSRYSHDPRTRLMGAGLLLQGARRDGSTFPVDISLSPLVEGSRRLIVAAIRPHDEAERARRVIGLLDTIVHQLSGIGLSLRGATIASEDMLRQRVTDAVESLDDVVARVRTILSETQSGHSDPDAPASP
jgi:PAS domain S-box-containing protein